MVGKSVCRTSKEQTHEVIDFGDRTYRRSWIFGSGLLLNRDDRRKAIDLVHVGTLHPPQKGSGVSRKTLHVPALTLCINGIKGQGAFATPT